MPQKAAISQESEITLLICSDSPEIVYQKIADISAIDDYQIIPGEPQLLEDYYFDTIQARLAAKKWGMRIRRIKNDLWITLKGPAQQTSWGGRERVETEMLWSEAALAKIQTELSLQGIQVSFNEKKYAISDPMEIMKNAGFHLIQRRDTKRAANAVVSKDKIQVELAVDSVIYYFSQGEIRHYELEIEAKDVDGNKDAEAIAEYLLGRYSSELKKWPHDKLMTGWAIKKMLTGGLLQGFLFTNNNLKPGAYDKIDEFLRHELSQ